MLGRRQSTMLQNAMKLVIALALATSVGLALSARQAMADVAQEIIEAEKPPKQFSRFGFFKNLHTLEPAHRVVPYSVRNELFSDHAIKSRFVYVPPDASARFHPVEAFEFPVGSALIKNFAFPADFRSPDDALRNIEVRVLLRQPGGWKTFAYVWNEDQSDAVLKVAGKRMDVSFVDKAGESKTISYRVPNKNQCKGCHFNNELVVPIGPKAQNLNFDRPETGNQLAEWVAAGLLEGAGEPASWASVPDWKDASAKLDARARAYLDINCAHCHRSTGPASNSGLFLTFDEKNRAAWGYRKRPVAAGRGTGGHEFAISPGNAEASILLHRMRSLETGVMMPELGRGTTDSDAVQLIADWINSLE